MEEAWTGPTARQFGGYPCSRLWRLSLAVAGCGAVAGVGSTVASGAEAVGTLVKDSMKDEDKDKEQGEAGSQPAKPE